MNIFKTVININNFTNNINKYNKLYQLKCVFLIKNQHSNLKIHIKQRSKAPK